MKRPIRYVRESFFYGREFVGDSDLDDQARRWLEDVANARRHGTTGERPLDRFERDERAALGPLAARPCVRLATAAAARSAPAKASVAAPVEVERRPRPAHAQGRPRRPALREIYDALGLAPRPRRNAQDHDLEVRNTAHCSHLPV